jgi:hypothetical protein
MAETGNTKHYDLEERTHEFARDVRGLVKQLPRTLANIEDARQLVNASGRALPFGALDLFRISGLGFRI